MKHKKDVAGELYTQIKSLKQKSGKKEKNGRKKIKSLSTQLHNEQSESIKRKVKTKSKL